MKLRIELVRKFSFLLTYWSARQQATSVTIDTHIAEVNPAGSPTIQRKATIKQEDDYSHI